MAGLNLIAAKRAKIPPLTSRRLEISGVQARSLMKEATWDLNYDLIFSIECLTAECELLTAEELVEGGEAVDDVVATREDPP